MQPLEYSRLHSRIEESNPDWGALGHIASVNHDSLHPRIVLGVTDDSHRLSVIIVIRIIHAHVALSQVRVIDNQVSAWRRSCVWCRLRE